MILNSSPPTWALRSSSFVLAVSLITWHPKRYTFCYWMNRLPDLEIGEIEWNRILLGGEKGAPLTPTNLPWAVQPKTLAFLVHPFARVSSTSWFHRQSRHSNSKSLRLGAELQHTKKSLEKACDLNIDSMQVESNTPALQLHSQGMRCCGWVLNHKLDAFAIPRGSRATQGTGVAIFGLMVQASTQGMNPTCNNCLAFEKILELSRWF